MNMPTKFIKRLLSLNNIASKILIILLTNQSYNAIGQTAVADLQKKYEKLAQQYLVKHPSIHNFYTITKKGIEMYASAKHKKNKQIECSIFWSEIDEFKKMILHTDEATQLQIYLQKQNQKFSWTHKQAIRKAYEPESTLKATIDKPLLGRRIAIDPGHIAGDLTIAKIEGRFIDITYQGKQYQFCEGNLTLTTAELLAQKLERKGATVLITRNKPNHTTAGIPYHQWVSQNLPIIVNQAHTNKLITKKQKREILKNPMRYKVHDEFFLPIDLRDRMKKINEFNPDITIVIHFNADAVKKPKDIITNNNYSMTFVAGSFMKNELNNPEERLAFVKLLLLGNLEKSFYLADQIQQQFIQYLRVPSIPTKNSLAYLNKASIFVKNGVYARNLGLCRLINSPIAYGESMYQDNLQEAKALSNNHYPYNPAPRIEQVAEAYFRGILLYFTK